MKKQSFIELTGQDFSQPIYGAAGDRIVTAEGISKLALGDTDHLAQLALRQAELLAAEFNFTGNRSRH